jgi:hypothetical protein
MENEYVLERHGVAWDVRFYGGGKASNPRFVALSAAVRYTTRRKAEDMRAAILAEDGRMVVVVDVADCGESR